MSIAKAWRYARDNKRMLSFVKWYLYKTIEMIGLIYGSVIASPFVVVGLLFTAINELIGIILGSCYMPTWNDNFIYNYGKKSRDKLHTKESQRRKNNDK